MAGQVSGIGRIEPQRYRTLAQRIDRKQTLRVTYLNQQQNSFAFYHLLRQKKIGRHA
jgi:hypothetical protein